MIYVAVGFTEKEVFQEEPKSENKCFETKNQKVTENVLKPLVAQMPPLFGPSLATPGGNASYFQLD